MSEANNGLGDFCHFREDCQVPAAVLTDLDGEILVGNALSKSQKSGWLFSGFRALCTRFFSASTASVVLVFHNPDINEHPVELPKELGFEREVCIWAGYIESIRQVVKADLLGARLIRRFVGIIENRSATASARGGYTIQLQMRCRMKWLMDSEVYFNINEVGRSNQTISRSEIILDIARRSIGYDPGDDCVNFGKKILYNEDFTVDIGDKNLGMNTTAQAGVWYESGQPLAGNTRPFVKVEPNPDFRIFTTRVAIGLSDTSNFILNNQIAIEMLKTLALQEVYPTEIFVDNRDGNFYYVPRANDVSGLEDERRFYRTYYFKSAPTDVDVDVDPNPNQRVIAFREESSSISLKTDFIVTTKTGTSANNSRVAEEVVHLRTRPHFLKNVDFASKFHNIKDSSVSDLGAAAVIALSSARTWGREVRAGMLVLLGDPSLTPGEIVQVFGSPLLPGGGLSRGKKDKEQFLEYNKRWNENIKEYAEIAEKSSRTGGVTGGTIELPTQDENVKAFIQPAVVSTGNTSSDNLLCEVSSYVGGKNQQDDLGFNEEPPTIWRVEAVLDKFNLGVKGYTTELALVSPF